MFWFNTAKLCLTIEEFSAILGYDPSKKSIAVSYDPKHKESLSNALDLPISITNGMIEGHMVNLHEIISRLINKHTYEVVEGEKVFFPTNKIYIGLEV